MEWNHIHGPISIALGIYVLLLAAGVIPRKPKDPEKLEIWRRKFRVLMYICAPFLFLDGVLRLCGWW